MFICFGAGWSFPFSFPFSLRVGGIIMCVYMCILLVIVWGRRWELGSGEDANPKLRGGG